MRTFRVLVIEDDPNVVLEVEMALEPLRVEVLSLDPTKDDFYESKHFRKVDLMLMDIMFDKEKTGFDYLKSIRHLNIPFAILTGFPKKTFVDNAHFLGATAFLTKPLNPSELQFVVLEAIKEVEQSANHDLFINDGKETLRIRSMDILWVHTEGNYSTIQTKNRKIVLKKSLSRLQEEMGMSNLVRIHRSSAINLSKINVWNRKENVVRMIDNVEFSVGAKYAKLLEVAIQDHFRSL